MCAVRMFAFFSVALLFTSGACRADLFEAAKQGDAGAVRAALAAGVPADVRDREGRTPLHLAAQAGHTDVIQILLDAGAEVDAEDRDFGSRPLYLAAVGAHVSVAKLLLERGALVDATNHTRDPVSAGSHHSNYTALDQASEAGHPDLVALLLDHGADVNGRANGISPLLLAVAPGHVEVARMLLDHGADVSAKDWAGASLLHLTGKPVLVKLLLDRGADKEARDDAGRTPLHVTAVMAWLEAATILLDSGADVNARDRQGWTPLHYAALASRKGKSFCLDLTRMLLRYGADPGAHDRDGNTPLHLGASGKTGLAAAALLLEARPDLGVGNNEGDTLLHAAAALGCVEWASVLLEKGADPRVRNWRDGTPLHLAARNDLRDLTDRLLDHGASVHDTTVDGDTPLHMVATGAPWVPHDASGPTLYRNISVGGNRSTQPIGLGDVDVRQSPAWPPDSVPGATAKALLRRGAEVNARSKAGRTALHCAIRALTAARAQPHYPDVYKRIASTLEVLLAAGANGDAADASGDTPVHLAARGLPDILQTLLERGADANARNVWGDTPLHVAAAAAGDAEARGDPSLPSITEQVVQNIAQCVRVLTEHGADVNACNDRGGDTPLHMAVALGGIPSVVQALLDGHADIDALNSSGETPLQLAIRERQKRDAIVQLLRDRGAK